MRRRSPFPGMDPWLESYWGDVHHTLISTLRRQLFSQLPTGLYAAIEENVYVVDIEADRQHFRPDVGVAEPVRLIFPTEPITEGHIEIRDLRKDNLLVTVIEVISPTNKSDMRGRATYIAKRAAYVAANVNVVELDLLRGGDHIVGIPPEYVEVSSAAPYKCAIRRADRSGNKTEIDYFSFSLRQRLPRIRIPLRNSDSEVIIDLQEPIDVAYEEGSFGIRIDYSEPPDPPLPPDDAAWAAELASSV